MPIGTTAAILGSAVIGAGASVLGSKSNSKAIKQATTAQTDSTAQQLAYQREADARNLGALSPFMQRGNIAGDTINAALGLGGSVMAPQTGAPPPGALTVPFNGGYPDAAQYPGYAGGSALSAYGPGGNVSEYPTAEGNFYTQNLPAQGAPAQTVGAAPQGQSPQQAALAAYDIFKQSTGYGTRLEEGNRSLASNYFGGGVGQSGAAMKAALRFGQNFASNEFGNWLGYLGNQQGLGFAGASALAGVSQGSADRMGQISQNNANTASQAAVARAQNQGALFSGIAGAVGTAAGALSSYRPPVRYAPALGVAPGYAYG